MNTPLVYNFILDHRVGGPHVYVDALRGALAGRVQSVIVTTGRGPLSEYSLVNLRHIWAPLYAIELIINALILTAWVMAKRIERKNAVFAVHGGANLAPLLAARVLGIPVVWHFHETTPRFRRMVAFGNWVLKGSTHALAVVAHKSTEVYELHDTVFLPASVDPVFWSTDKVSKEGRDACGWAESPNGGFPPMRLLVVGNLNPLKGMDVLLDALAEVEGPWHLKIVGAPLTTHQDYAEALYRRAAEITKENRGSQSEFLGWQDKEMVRNLLATCDVFVLPSRSEACPIALLEGMSMLCRCVAADVGDVRLMMEHYQNGRIFPAGSVTACRDEIVNMRGQCGMPPKIPATISHAWQLDEVAARAEKLYRHMLNLE